MPCETRDLGEGHGAILCTRGRRRAPLCAVCRQRPATRLCDAVLRPPKGTCDKPLCVQCAINRGKLDFCCARHATMGPQLELGGKP